jgi:YggT family protein
MFNTLHDGSLFLIQLLFDLALFLFLARVILQWINTNPYNPLFLSIAKWTDPLLKPLYRLFPPVRGIDFSAILLLITLATLKIACLFKWQTGVLPHFPGLLILAFADLLHQIFNLFFYATIILALLSWINTPMSRSPLIEVLVRMVEPLLSPLRRILPSVSGLDFSPLVLMIGLKLFTIVIVQPLIQIGQQLS